MYTLGNKSIFPINLSLFHLKWMKHKVFQYTVVKKFQDSKRINLLQPAINFVFEKILWNPKNSHLDMTGMIYNSHLPIVLV